MLYYFKEKEVDQITLPNGINVHRPLSRFTGLRTTRLNFIFRVDILRLDTPMELLKCWEENIQEDDFKILFAILFKWFRYFQSDRGPFPPFLSACPPIQARTKTLLTPSLQFVA